MPEPQFEDFISQLKVLRQPGLAVAGSEAEIQDYSNRLKSTGFSVANSLEEFLDAIENNASVVTTVGLGNIKVIYDILSQIPLDHIEIWDKRGGVTHQIQHPDGLIVLLATEKSLAEVEKMGFDLLNKIGPVWRQ